MQNGGILLEVYLSDHGNSHGHHTEVPTWLEYGKQTCVIHYKFGEKALESAKELKPQDTDDVVHSAA